MLTAVESEGPKVEPGATVFVVDDDPSFRKSMRWLIESVGLNVQTYASGQEFLDAYDDSVAGCVVMDVRMPGPSGLDLQERLRENGIEIPVIIVTAYGDVPMAVRAMKAGAIDFVEKPFSDQQLLDQIQRAITEDLKNRQDREWSSTIEQRVSQLTPRERQVMDRVVAGLSSKEIGAELGISFKTIEAHRAKIMKKMQARTVSHLIRMNLQAHRE